METNTRKQSYSQLWFQHRIEHITASNFKPVARTNPSMPLQKFDITFMLPGIVLYIQIVCYSVVSWGYNHEKEAKESYITKSQLLHQDLQIKDAGLFIDHGSWSLFRRYNRIYMLWYRYVC